VITSPIAIIIIIISLPTQLPSHQTTSLATTQREDGHVEDSAADEEEDEGSADP
jgi:hypothetical protein